MQPAEIPEESSVKGASARCIPIGRPISSRAYTELKKKAASRALSSKKGQEDSSS
jgi:hypothetical protein